MNELTLNLRRNILSSDRGREKEKMNLNVINLNEGHCGERKLWTVWPVTSIPGKVGNKLIARSN